MTMQHKNALISVYDKSGIIDFAQELSALGWSLVVTRGTGLAIAATDVPFIEIEAFTGFPEILDGRVKTLHPRIYGGILADRSKPEHLITLQEHKIPQIDLVVCNLYPFAKDPSIEKIDIGGMAMIRAAAKNYESVVALVRPEDYPLVLRELREVGGVSLSLRQRLAQDAFAYTAQYDSAIAKWFVDAPL